MKSITIQDVADLAGVSIKTVSRVLNREPHVRQTTVEAVLSAIKALNYRPNLAARALASSRSYLIGLYYDNESIGYIAEMQYGSMVACRNSGYHLLVEQLGGVKTRDELYALFSLVRIDGAVLTPPLCDRPELLEVLEELGIAYVRIAPSDQFERAPYVYMDDRLAAFEMTQHLQSLGHTKIGFIRGHSEHSATALRYAGFTEAMQQAGLTVRPQWVQPGNFSFRSGVGAAERLLSLEDRPTAIFASNDDMARGVMAVANRLHLRLPQDLSVAGFDDAPIAQVVWPQLTTIRQPVANMAAAAVETLISGGSAEDAAVRRLDFELIVRGSTAPAG